MTRTWNSYDVWLKNAGRQARLVCLCLKTKRWFMLIFTMSMIAFCAYGGTDERNMYFYYITVESNLVAYCYLSNPFSHPKWLSPNVVRHAFVVDERCKEWATRDSNP